MEDSPELGIDLSGPQRIDVENIYYSKFARRVRAGGYDVESVLQEVFKGILIRNAGRCPFDARKSSLGHYIYLVCLGVTVNYHHARVVRSPERAGIMVTSPDGQKQTVDVRDSDIVDTAQAPGDSIASDDAWRARWRRVEELGGDVRLAQRMAPMLVRRATYVEMAQSLKAPLSHVRRTRHILLRVGQEFTDARRCA